MLNIGMITCNYFLRVYDYKQPENFDWMAMTEKFKKEFTREHFITLAKEIRALGYGHLEIWEPTFSYAVYTEDDAKAMRAELDAMGFKSVVYCVGGFYKGSMPNIEKEYAFAKALGAKVMSGCISKPDADELLAEVERCGLKYGIKYGIENHPLPNFESPLDIYNATKALKTVGANFDAGIYNQQYYDVLAAADLLKDKIYHVHFKDTMKGGHGCLPIGDGDAPMWQLIKRLQQWGYTGMVSVEYEAECDPAPGLKKSIEYINAHM